MVLECHNIWKRDSMTFLLVVMGFVNFSFSDVRSADFAGSCCGCSVNESHPLMLPLILLSLECQQCHFLVDLLQQLPQFSTCYQLHSAPVHKTLILSLSTDATDCISNESTPMCNESLIILQSKTDPTDGAKVTVYLMSHAPRICC